MPTSPKSPRPAGAIERKYEHQLNAIRASAKSFDAGEVWEAERISTAVQTLFHSGGATTGLIDQLGLSSRCFLDSATKWHPRNKMPHCSLVSFAKFKTRSAWLAELDNRPMRFIPFTDWWNGPVLTDGVDAGHTFSRRELVRVMRNQDGGSHVDPLVDSAYAGMLNAIGFVDENDQLVTADGELYAMRQIGHEVLKSLVPSYRRRPSEPTEVIWRSFLFQELEEAREDKELPDYTQTEPKQACPCGSGKVFRACHALGAQSPKLFQRMSSQFVAPPNTAYARLGFSVEPSSGDGET